MGVNVLAVVAHERSDGGFQTLVNELVIDMVGGGVNGEALPFQRSAHFLRFEDTHATNSSTENISCKRLFHFMAYFVEVAGFISINRSYR